MAQAAAIAISSVIVVAKTSSVPRKIPGKPIELFTWLGKSERPVPTILTPASFASHGQISGIGFAMMNAIASLFIVESHSLSIVPGPGLEAAISTSLPSIAVAVSPVRPAAFVARAYSHL